MIRRRTVHVAACGFCALSGCATVHTTAQSDTQAQMLALLMPSRIEIVAPFTRVRSFDDDNIPDGIELLFQAVNSFDDPGVVVGSVHCELYEYVPASGNNKGRRVEYWDIELATVQDQRAFWNRATQMYEFRLRVDPSRIPDMDRFILQVTYNSPLGDHLTDECVIDSRAVRKLWKRAEESRTSRANP